MKFFSSLVRIRNENSTGKSKDNTTDVPGKCWGNEERKFEIKEKKMKLGERMGRNLGFCFGHEIGRIGDERD